MSNALYFTKENPSSRLHSTIYVNIYEINQCVEIFIKETYLRDEVYNKQGGDEKGVRGGLGGSDKCNRCTDPRAACLQQPSLECPESLLEIPLHEC